MSHPCDDCTVAPQKCRLTIADADEYYEIGHYTHEDIYTYMMKIENAFVCWVALGVKKSPLYQEGLLAMGPLVSGQ